VVSTQAEDRSFAENRRTAVVLDAHPLWAEAVEGVLRRVGVDVLGKATTAPEALSLIRHIRPDLFITDISVGDRFTTFVKGILRGIKCRAVSPHLQGGNRGDRDGSSDLVNAGGHLRGGEGNRLGGSFDYITGHN